MQTNQIDVIIIGAGPAGLTAGIYCGRYGLETLILEKTAPGGQLLKIDVVENYPGFPDGVNSFELAENKRKQAQKFGAKFINAEATAIQETSPGTFTTTIADGKKYCSRAVIIATGANPKELGVKGERELQGRGISYCATCDGPLFKNKDVVVVGGGDTAVTEAIYLSRIVKKLTLVHRRDRLRAAKTLQDRLMDRKNVEIRWNSVVTEVVGSSKVEGVKVKDVKTNGESEIQANGVFVLVGIDPNSLFLKGIVELDKYGFIISDDRMKSSCDGIFACGDARVNPLKQVITACAEGAIASSSCLNYIETLKTT